MALDSPWRARDRVALQVQPVAGAAVQREHLVARRRQRAAAVGDRDGCRGGTRPQPEVGDAAAAALAALRAVAADRTAVEPERAVKAGDRGFVTVRRAKVFGAAKVAV